jgi:hypothetical protein
VYQAFDEFLDVETWHTTHALDEERFYRALDKVVRDKDFNSEEMATYMCQKFSVSRGGGNHFSEAIERYTDSASAVRGFLEATKAI